MTFRTNQYIAFISGSRSTKEVCLFFKALPWVRKHYGASKRRH